MNPEIGMMIYGFCNGYFGRDSYDDKRIEAIGVDWIVARPCEEGAKAEFVAFDSWEERDRLVAEWSQKKDDI